MSLPSGGVRVNPVGAETALPNSTAEKSGGILTATFGCHGALQKNSSMSEFSWLGCSCIRWFRLVAPVQDESVDA